jgi:hypothetical protein
VSRNLAPPPVAASEGRKAPDLARIPNGTGFYELGAAMWNH